MSEKIPGGPMAEEMGIVSEGEREGKKEVAEFEAMVDAFEARHSMEALFAISDLTVAEAQVHPIREPARKDLAPIFAKKKKIEQLAGISEEQGTALKARWKRISQAVGIINNNMVDHTR